jgi:hypothetical protein
MNPDGEITPGKAECLVSESFLRPVGGDGADE